MKALQKIDGVYTVSGPMCRWQMILTRHDGESELVKKQTRWVTNSRALAEILDGWATPHIATSLS